MDALLREAVRLHHEGNPAGAEAAYLEILDARPDHAEALHLLGVLSGQTGKPDLAIDRIRRAIAIRDDIPSFHWNLGLIYQGLGLGEEATASFRRSLSLGPGTAEEYFHFGALLQDRGRFEEAGIIYRESLRRRPDSVDALGNLAIVLQAKGRLEEAERLIARAIDLAPRRAELAYNLGTVLQEAGRFEEAEARYREAIAIRPDYAEAHNNLGLVLKSLGRLEEAVHCYEKTLEIQPGHVEARWNLAIGLLLRGDLARGWEFYESRWRLKDLTTPIRDFPQPPWEGEALDGKTILLHAEQGLGDTIQFVRYAPLVAARGGRVVLEVGEELLELLEGIPGVATLVRRGEDLPAFDTHCPLLSLPGVFRTTLDTIPWTGPYLNLNARKAASWAGAVDPSDHRLKVGLRWSGRKAYKRDHQRSILSDTLAPLRGCEGVLFFSLEKADAGGEPSPPSGGIALVDRTADFHSMADTAALISRLDLVITVDTSVAHLSAALGRPTWILLPHVPDWRWMMGREDSPWYPTVRLFRQPVAGDWESVIERVAWELAEKTG